MKVTSPQHPILRIFWKACRTFSLFLFSLAIFKLSWVLWASADAKALLRKQARKDLFSRKKYLHQRLIQNQLTPADLPSFLPPRFRGEWALVAHSMTVAAITNLAFLYPDTQPTAQKEVSLLIKRMFHPKIRAFDTRAWREDPLRSLQSQHGHIGYLGHLNWALAAHHLLGSKEHSKLFEQISQALLRRLKNTTTSHLETYPRETYIPDNSVIMASLALYARIHKQPLPTEVQRWLRTLNKLRHPKLQLFPFSLNAQGKVSQGPRGSGATWDAFFLCFIDPALAKAHYQHIKSYFFDQLWWGIAGIREWPRGIQGYGDVDSGPVLFGLSPSATGFAIGSAHFHKDQKVLQKLLRTAEMAGFTFQWGGQRYYLTAPIVGDAILLAMQSHTPWDRRFLRETKASPTSSSLSSATSRPISSPLQP
ncbi:MAG: hypothetical protein H6727_04705 [Myxococcales bacterium]|nr:hypothetical protein [Myxococcales bacterium]